MALCQPICYGIFRSTRGLSVRTVSPGFFSSIGVPIIAGRDFNEGDRRDGERVVIVSQSLAQRMFPNMDAVNRRMMWTDPVTKFIGMSRDARRIVGVVPDVDDEHLVPSPSMTVYHPMEQEIGGGRLFVHAKMDPYPLGAVIGVCGIVAGAIAGLALTRVVSSYITEVEMPGALPIVGAAAVLVAAAILASLVPAAMASRVDVLNAL
jgi:MacB-like periplasmic core domain